MRILPAENWTLTDLFLERVRLSPEGRAYRWFDGTAWVDMSWGEAAVEVGRWRAALAKENLQPGDRVGLCSRNRVEWMCFDQAALGLGLVVVPLFYNDRPDNMAYCLTDAGAKLLLLEDGKLWEAMRAQVGTLERVVCLSNASKADAKAVSLKKWLPNKGVALQPSPTPAGGLATLVYTSGTTGRPKGAILTHHNQMVLTTSMTSLIGINTKDRILHTAPLFHSAELNLYLNPGTYLGSTHVVVRDFVPNNILSLIQKEKISQFFGAPVMYTFMMLVPDFDKYDLSSVRYYGYGAAPMAAESVRQMIDKFKSTSFFCLCGFTEAGPGGIALQPEEQIRKAGAGGKYIVNMESRIADDKGVTITKPGVVGELCIKGDTIMKGYYKNPEATAEAIRDGWVYSGDLAVMDDEGYITLVDRKKDMIITGGENVYSKEVEDAIYEHPSVQEAAIIGIPDPRWGETVMAVVAPKQGKTLDLDELKKFLGSRIADFKIPRLLEVMPALPKNVSGKVLKYKLREQFSPKEKK
jgi:acyl-CoA synthetase (AMP-forming)/AMP-acid ligase II